MKQTMKLKTAYRFLLCFVPIITLQAIAQNRSPARQEGPCDIYAAAGCPCVAAHSTTRALYRSYNGPLYQVMRQSDGRTLDIGLVKTTATDAGGYVNAAAQDAFLSGTIGWITKIYDQSGKGNDLMQAPPGTFKGPAKGAFNTLPIADMAPVTIGGHKGYGVYIMPGMGLRNNNATGLAINDEPEGIYYVINGKHFDSGCCFDYGNSSTNGRAVGTGTMETTYYGISTAWGSGNGSGPWIMADMEAGLFSGYNAKKNDVPSIDSWRFVSAFVDGGGGNKWDLRGGNAQQGNLTTFYSGIRPGTPNSNAYYPMNKKGAILLGNGGDNGNGSAGTFYEGVMTTGFPNEAATDAVQANIVKAKYDVQRMKMSRLTTFTPRSQQDVNITFTNTTGLPARGVRISMMPRIGWTIKVKGSGNTAAAFPEIAPGESVTVTFTLTSPATNDGGLLTAKTEWKNSLSAGVQSDRYTQRFRNAPAVKINEVRFNTGNSPANQFIELYNASGREVDISNWNLVSTQSGWAPLTLAAIPAGTKIKANSFYLLGLAASGLVSPVKMGDNRINVQTTVGFEPGHKIDIDGETCTIKNAGSAAAPLTTLFIPVSTGPWLRFPAGSSTLPVTSAAGFNVGEKIGIDLGGNYEVATVTKVGKAATQTSLSIAAKAGDITIKVADNSNITMGDLLTISTGARTEHAKVKRIVKVATTSPRGGPNAEAGEIELTAPLQSDHMTGVDVSSPGTGISFSPATRFVHKSGDAVQALGSGIILETKLTKSHKPGAAIINLSNTSQGYQGTIPPQQWYGFPLSPAAGSIALMDATGKIFIDGIVYGSQQSNSSANGTIASPEIATLEGEQIDGGCIMVIPAAGRNTFQPTTAADQTNRSFGRFPDGSDSDNNCRDFQFQNAVTLSFPVVSGSDNIKVSSVAGFNKGQKILIGSATNAETAVVETVGTAGGTRTLSPAETGSTKISVGSIAGFATGQTIFIDSNENRETVVVVSTIVARRRFGNSAGGPTDSIVIAAPLKHPHAVNTPVTGSGITFEMPLRKNYDSGTPVAADVPTPGEPNRYARKPE